MTNETGAEITVTRRSSRQEGTCNACTRHYHGNGCNEHVVFVIETRGVQVRVCSDCRRELLEKLRAAR